MRMVTSILNSTSVYIHMNRSRMHRVFHWIPAWMTVNMMTLKQATSIITSMIPGEKMSPFASQSKAPVNMKQAISLGSWWASMLGLTIKWAAGAWPTISVSKCKKKQSFATISHLPLDASMFLFPRWWGLVVPPENYMLSFHISAKHWNTVLKKTASATTQEPTVINLPRNWKRPNSFHLQQKQPQKNMKRNISKFQLLTLTSPTPGQLNMKSAKVAVRWGRHKSPLQRIPPWHHVVRWRVKGREKKRFVHSFLLTASSSPQKKRLRETYKLSN